VSPFYLSDLVSPLFFVNLPTDFSPSGVTPWRVSPGAVRPSSPRTSLVTPLDFEKMQRENGTRTDVFQGYKLAQFNFLN